MRNQHPNDARDAFDKASIAEATAQNALAETTKLWRAIDRLRGHPSPVDSTEHEMDHLAHHLRQRFGGEFMPAPEPTVSPPDQIRAYGQMWGFDMDCIPPDAYTWLANLVTAVQTGRVVAVTRGRG